MSALRRARAPLLTASVARRTTSVARAWLDDPTLALRVCSFVPRGASSRAAARASGGDVEVEARSVSLSGAVLTFNWTG